MNERDSWIHAEDIQVREVRGDWRPIHKSFESPTIIYPVKVASNYTKG